MNKALYSHSLFSFFIDPLFYLCSFLAISYTGFVFFFVNRFFVSGYGSSDLIVFFNAVAHISILTVPLLVFRLRYFFNDGNIPFPPLKRFFTLSLSAFTACLIPEILLAALPVCVNFFGRVDIGQVLAGYAGIVFYTWAAVCLSVFLSVCARKTRGSFSLLLTVAVLSAFNFMHIIPLYMRTGDVLSSFLQNASFAWHFDAASKGIVDSRDFVFYIIISVVFLCMAAFVDNRRTGLDTRKPACVLFLLTIVFSSSALNRLYFRLDLTQSKTYTVSSVSRSLCNELENPLRITCFQSKELRQFYPEANEVTEYLKAFAAAGNNIVFSIEKADPDRMQRLGIQGRQIRSGNSTKIEYNYVYSAVLLQYLGSSSIIPFVISNKTLEYDLTQRIQQLVSGKTRPLYVICGNGMSAEEDYSYVVPWLSARGFMPAVIPLDRLSQTLEEIDADSAKNTSLLVIGSKSLSQEQSGAIKIAAEKGCPVLVLSSPYTADIKNDWNITKNENDTLIPVLNSWGFAFERSLAEDLSNFPLTMTSGEGAEISYQTVNYPLWISVLPQAEAFEGVTVCWATPVSCYGKAEAMLLSSPYSWTQEESGDKENLFIVNPFIIPKNADGKETGSLVLAAEVMDNKNNFHAAVISDQYFLNALMTGFTSASEQGDFRNYDYVASILLKLRGEDEIGALMRKTSFSNSLYKIQTEEDFLKARKNVIIAIFGLLNASLLVFAISVNTIRAARNKDKKNAAQTNR